MGASVERQIATVDPALVVPYRGAIGVLDAGGADWQRHLGASLRTLVDALLSNLAPDAVLETFFSNPSDQKQNGQFTRRAKLTYIFRDVAQGEYARMTENDIDITLATFYPTNREVHLLVPSLTPQQGRVLLRRVQGCIATILATIEA